MSNQKIDLTVEYKDGIVKIPVFGLADLINPDISTAIPVLGKSGQIYLLQTSNGRTVSVYLVNLDKGVIEVVGGTDVGVPLDVSRDFVLWDYVGVVCERWSNHTEEARSWIK